MGPQWSILFRNVRGISPTVDPFRRNGCTTRGETNMQHAQTQHKGLPGYR